MESPKINLHTDYKRVLSVMALFSLISIILNVIIGLTTNEHLTELNALLRSDYIYSVITHKSVAVDDYYQFNAGISFSVSPETKTSLNAEVLMQSEITDYTRSVYWNAESLSESGVAISKGLAKRYDMHIGDNLFSKHNVDGTIHEYSIEQLLPDVIHTRISKQNSFYSGVIIMGYDKLYVDNISHDWIAFTSKSIEDLSSDKAVSPEDIVYRDDEIASELVEIIPYVVVLSIISVIGLIIFQMFLSKGSSYNFRRLMTLGFEKQSLNRAFCKLTREIGAVAILIAAVASAGIFTLLDICPIGLILLCWIVLLEFIVLWITSAVLKGRLWRR